jgi:hypothetical protein
MLLRYPRTGVGHPDGEVPVDRFSGYAHLARVGEFDRVADTAQARLAKSR